MENDSVHTTDVKQSANCHPDFQESLEHQTDWKIHQKHGEWLSQHYISSRLTNSCLRKIICIRWPKKISDEDLWRAADQEPVATLITRRKWGWIGHALRKPASNILHHPAGYDLESTGEEKEGKTPEHMAQRHPGRNAEKRSLPEDAGKDSPESGALEVCSRWPMLLMGQKALQVS